MYPAIVSCVALAVLLAQAVVNPSLQPADIIKRHRNVVVGTVTGNDAATRTITVRVERVVQGDYASPSFALHIPTPTGDGEDGRRRRGDLLNGIAVGDVVVGFLGKSRGERLGAGLLYQGMEWHEIACDGDDPARWTWKRGCGDQMKGTFVGDAAELARMVTDAQAGRAFFPALPFTRFAEDRVIGTWTGSLRGVAMADLDGDGRVDLLGTSEAGCRAFLQRGPLAFTDATEALGLAGAAARSVSVADVDGDGRADLLLDGRLFAQRDGRFAADARLGPAAAQQVLVAAFVELDGDGWPDVLVSRAGGGLAAWRNPGTGGGAFVEVTAALGLDRPEAGAGQTGFFCPGDWNGDGRTDVFYASAGGFLLVQDSGGALRPQPHDLQQTFGVSDGGQPGVTGAGCFAPLRTEDGVDLAVCGDSRLSLITSRDGRMEDIARLGNETNVTRTDQIATLAEDLNMDGYVDLFTLTRRGDLRNIFHTNRGYGSYMVDDLYAESPIMPGATYTVGHWGAAAGDVDGDGATDLLLGGVDGKLRLAINASLAGRVAAENDRYQQQVLARTAIVSVDPGIGRGVIGARVTVADAAGRTIAWRRIGDAVLSGCSGLPQLRIAVRHPGPLRVSIRWSDGAAASEAIAATPGGRIAVAFRHPKQ